MEIQKRTHQQQRKKTLVMNNTYPAKARKEDVHPETYSTNPNIACSMNEQFVVPPPRVWEKIKSTLDKQDKSKSFKNAFFSRSSHHLIETKNHLSFCFAAVSVTALAGLVLACR